MQNASEHAFPEGGAGGDGLVVVSLKNDGAELHVQVRDDGEGLPEGFSIEDTDSLGLSIVSNLVVSQLGGSIEMYSDAGTVVELTIPLSRTR